MYLDKLRMAGHMIPGGAEMVAARLNLDWSKVYALVEQYGPVVITILTRLLAGTPAGTLVAQYGQLALTVIETVLGGLLPAPVVPPEPNQNPGPAPAE